jgi:predicted amidohydrolase YtcJ
MYLFNGKIYTLDARRPVVSALAIENGKVASWGEPDEIPSHLKGRPYDLGGRTVWPGLTDAHLHLDYYSLGLQKIDCETSTRAECLRRVAERAAQTPEGEWVLGHGWNQNLWPEGFGSAALLDEVAPHHPVFLTAKSLHAAWANTAALRAAGLSGGTPDPVGGKLGRLPDGELDGILYEDAMGLVGGVAPEVGPARLAEAIEHAQAVLWRFGITGVHDFDRRRCFLALQDLRRRGRLGLRVLKSIPLDDLPHAHALGLSTGLGDDRLRIGHVKLFADGALGPQTAAMLQPYEGGMDGRGMLLMDAEEMFEHGRKAVEVGLPLAIHAIGDAANHEMLNGYQHLRQYEQELTGQHRLRHRIEHVQLLHPDDAGRLAALDIVASMQPIHATSDMEMADRFWGSRSEYAYAPKLQLQQGARVAFGSDAPVESPNPWWGLHAAVTRRRRDGAPGPEGWYPEQRLSLQEALEGFTTGPAYLAGWEARVGKLAPGYYADLILLEQDPFEQDGMELWEILPSATMVEGEIVYEK